MHTDLHEFLARFAGAVAMTLLPVVLTACLTLPSALQRQAGDRPIDPNAPVAHMT